MTDEELTLACCCCCPAALLPRAQTLTDVYNGSVSDGALGGSLPAFCCYSRRQHGIPSIAALRA